MTIAELLANEEFRQREFPVARDQLFLAHAAVCPLPRRVADAIAQYAARGALNDQEKILPAHWIGQARDQAARLLHAQPDEIAFVGPTSLGLSMVAAGLPLRKHDNIVAYLDDYPSNVYPWMALADKGVQVRFVNPRELGRIRPMDILSLLDEHTRLVALASCHFLAGYRIDLAAVGEMLHQRGVLWILAAVEVAARIGRDVVADRARGARVRGTHAEGRAGVRRAAAGAERRRDGRRPNL